MDNQSIDLLREWFGERRETVQLAAHVNVRSICCRCVGFLPSPLPVEHAAQIEEFTSGKVQGCAFPGCLAPTWPGAGAVSDKNPLKPLRSKRK